MSTDRRASIAALEILLAHFPNVRLAMRDIDRAYAEDVVCNLPTALNDLRERLKSELRALQAQ